ncbi:hypothetical protein SAMN05216251_108210 [Actinacidiphila alni]|uniref:CHAP domain-containing protein n=1 Tax=Actinacidiphila alni TaxID=380248 RepID=A0A1I2G1A1_9ACTN|nr:hypothetical protein [Actinacidiphila alni]SFF11322.1 hypothetical protein SAMN05216251_108210 [Actinacidiphila alni]
MVTPDWRRLVDHVMAVPERIYEHWNSSDGWDNDTEFGKQFGENRVSWCVIFDWDMYADVDLKAVVPKVDNVNVFTNWAKQRGQWSEYPSLGAWVNLSNGGHTEIVTGFDEVYVYTKGGNSVKAGSTDNGQGNGVWSHKTLRRSSHVVGYFAPRFPDGICPPTADPADPRGGKPVAAWRWTGPAAPTTPQNKPEEDTMPAPVDVWAYKNTKAGDKHDMHQALVNAETNSAKAASAVAALDAKVAKLAVGGVDLDALAAKVAALLPRPATAAEIADLLAARLKA